MHSPLPVDTVFTREDAAGLRAMVNKIIDSTAVTDIHTHLYPPAFRELLMWGIDDLLTYHYLIAEFFRASSMSYAEFWALDKTQQADAIWRALFVNLSPISEACRGVVTVLHKLGFDVSNRDLHVYREWFAQQDPRDHVDRVFDAAGLKSVVMTNDPFDRLEREHWEHGPVEDGRFKAALRIDPLLNDWSNAYPQLKAWGYDVEGSLLGSTCAEVRRFLEDWIKRMKALYMAVSLPPEFAFPEDSARARIIEECVLPVAREHNMPFALMIGVTRQVNPALRMAGDGVGYANLRAMEYLCAHYPRNKFMVTVLARENQHELCVAARKFRNLLVFGCWWFLNNPSLIEEITRMRFEMLGLSTVPQHSDARVLEQVIYKWDHSREIIAKVLRHKYADLVATGWHVTESDITRDVSALLGGNFWSFLSLTL